jgi:hypothetical protein
VWLTLRAGIPEAPQEGFYAIHQRRPLNGLYLSARTLDAIDLQSIYQWTQAEVVDRDWERFDALVNGLGERLWQDPSRKQDLEALRALHRLADQHWVRGGGEDWESFVLGIFIQQEVPTGFPLRHAPVALVPEVFLTDSERADEKAIKPPEQAQEP